MPIRASAKSIPVQADMQLEPLEGRLQLSGSAAPALAAPAVKALPSDRAPDLVPWASKGRGYIYGWELDSLEIPGRVLLRLSTAMVNLGQGPLELRGGKPLANDRQEVIQRVYSRGGGFRDRRAGSFAYHPSHGHTHMDNFASYRLRRVVGDNGVGAIVGQGSKTSFCLLDIERYPKAIAGSSDLPSYDMCDERRQGISAGWADVYEKWLPDQWVDVTKVPSGRYWLEVVVDPSNRILESNERNNVRRILINLKKPAAQAPDAGWTAMATSVAPAPQALPCGVESRPGIFNSERAIDTSMDDRDVICSGALEE